MKAVIFFLLTLLSFTAFAQFPTIQQDGTPNTMKFARGAYGVDSGFVYRYAFPDTSKASIGFLKNIPGITIMVNDTVFFRSRDAKKWIKMGTGSSGSSSGGISNIELNEGFGIILTPSPIDSTGSIAVDSTVIATRNYSDSNYNDVEQLDDSTFLIKRPNGTKDTIQILTGSSIAGSSGIDSIWRVAGIDSFYWRKSGITYRVKDSIGGGVGGITLIQMNDSLALYIKASDSVLKYVTKQALVDSINSRAVISFAGRKGAVTPDETDYASYYPRLSQSYSNPVWIFDLPWSKITGTSGVMLKSDSSIYQPKYRSDTARTNIYGAINGKLGTADSTGAAGFVTRKAMADTGSARSGAVYLLADFNTSNTTATNTGLKFTAAANTAYRIVITGTVSKATSGTGVKIAIGAPTGSTIKAINQVGGSTLAAAMANTLITAINTLGATFSAGIGIEVPFRVEGILTTAGTAGDIELQVATVTSNTATIYAGTSMSYMRATGL